VFADGVAGAARPVGHVAGEHVGAVHLEIHRERGLGPGAEGAGEGDIFRGGRVVGRKATLGVGGQDRLERRPGGRIVHVVGELGDRQAVVLLPSLRNVKTLKPGTSGGTSNAQSRATTVPSFGGIVAVFAFLTVKGTAMPSS